MNNTNSFINKLDCSDADIKFYISLGGNVLLGLITVVSEFLPYSRCKSNGILQTTEHIVKSITKQDLTTDEQNVREV